MADCDCHKPTGSSKEIKEFRKKEQDEMEKMRELEVQKCIKAAIKVMENTPNYMKQGTAFTEPSECAKFSVLSIDKGPYAGAVFRFSGNRKFQVDI